MTLSQAIAATGMTPPHEIIEGRWLRFPGVGKGRSNRSGWCRVIGPTFAIFGDWSSGISEIWRDDSHRDDENTAALLAQARQRERAFAAEQQKRQIKAANDAAQLIREAAMDSHPYLSRKGFADRKGLVYQEQLLIPVRDVSDYSRIISVQKIAPDGKKLFLPDSRARGGIYRIGAEPHRARRLVLCEGYATGLSIEAALQRLPGAHTIIVCFSARNLEIVAESFQSAAVAADHDESKTGEQSAQRTGLKWVMPPDIGTDFNDMHLRHGLHAVTEVLRSL